ncbi:MAG: response regulator [Cytophagaceae bacterium]|nr:response regulator [Cytophagaceae bacterium]
MSERKQIKVLLADDDEDDRFFFERALTKLAMPIQFDSVQDGEELIHFLTKNKSALPDVLFLDINMPRKNGYECLKEIKLNKDIKNLPVIMYSTSLEEPIADSLYDKGAHYYLRKGTFPELVKYLQLILAMLEENELKRPLREDFVVNLMEV